MYRLLRQKNGQMKQVKKAELIKPAPPQMKEDLLAPPPVHTETEQFPNPLQAKGVNNGQADFVEQEERQFDLIKQNESQQAKFQTQKLQWNNYQVLNFQIIPTDSTSSQAYFNSDYNDSVAVGTALDGGIMFGTNTADVSKAKYYNIVYANARLSISGGSTPALSNPCFIEFYLMQKLTTGDFGGKIPRQIESVVNSTGVQSIVATGDEFGVQSFGVDVFNENAYYTQSPDLKGMRSIGVALKRINLKFESALDLANLKLDVEIGYDLKTEGNNY